MQFPKNGGLIVFRTCAIFFILLCVIRGRDAVRVECKPSLTQMVRHCDVGTTTPFSRITVLEQDKGSYCMMNNNYFLVLNGTNSYIWVMWGCFAVFDVSTHVSVQLGAWGSCSVTCGPGTRTRERSCSTGREQDCWRLPDWISATENCNLGPCKDEPQSSPPLCGFSPKDYRVYGGQEANKCEFPWMAMVHKPGTTRRCGGTIIDQTHILTAAHCLNTFDDRMLTSTQDTPDTLMVYTGSSYMPVTEKDDPDKIPGLVKHRVIKVAVHEEYDAFDYVNDIAVLTLSKAIEYDRCAVPICTIDSSMSVYKATGCRTMGWGMTEDPKHNKGINQLQWTDIDIISEETCRYYYGSRFHPKNFCAGGNGHDACGGDSGGPLVCKGPRDRYYQYGIVSSGFRYNCGYYSSQYVHLQNYTQWLSQHI